MTGLSLVEMGRFGSEHELDLGHMKFETAFQHLNESGFGLKNKNHYGYVKDTWYLMEGCFEIEFPFLPISRS
jgi:hypothetical protein